MTPRTYEQSYGDLFTYPEGLSHLYAVRHLVALMKPGESYTLSSWLFFLSRVMGEVDAWLLLNALDHLWFCGELWRHDSVEGNSIIQRWVRT